MEAGSGKAGEWKTPSGTGMSGESDSNWTGLRCRNGGGLPKTLPRVLPRRDRSVP
jgi:hypothetical protein